MKHLLLLHAFLFITYIASAQTNDEAESLARNTITIPDNLCYSTSAMATYVQANVKTQKEKYYAIYHWVTSHIRYDTDSMNAFNWNTDFALKAATALRRRRGVCENYTALLNEIAVRCGLQSFIIPGYTKQFDHIDKTGHAWCAIKINNEWSLSDPTWDEGSSELKYFMTRPDVFIQSHMPFDPIWQLLDQPVTREEFYEGKPHTPRGAVRYNFDDSIRGYTKLDQLEQLEATRRRVTFNENENALVRNYLSYLTMEIGIINEDQDMRCYNSAVENINQATTILNQFIQYRNSMFQVGKPDSALAVIFKPTENFLLSAQGSIHKLDASPTNFQYNTGLLKSKLDELRIKIGDENNFLNKYLTANAAERKRLFMK